MTASADRACCDLTSGQVLRPLDWIREHRLCHASTWALVDVSTQVLNVVAPDDTADERARSQWLRVASANGRASW